MAADNKTEKATSKKRKDERKEGNVVLSKDVVSVVLIFCSFYALKSLFPYMYNSVNAFMKRFIVLSGEMTDLNQDSLAILSNELLKATAIGVLPLGIICMVAGILAYGVQTRFLFATKSLRPKFSKINPLEGIKRLFSMKNAVELVKSLLKLVILAFILVSILKDNSVSVMRTMDMSIVAAGELMFEMMMGMITRVCLFFAVVAFLDYLFQRWDYERKIMMSKQELKEEFKQTEGNPEIKGKIKETQRARARMRMMQAVPEADVIIRNPTHYAVALKYDKDLHNAPIVVAKGQSELALRIVEMGEKHGVVCIEDKPLARGLYAEAEIDREIPLNYYAAVAEILVQVLKINKELR
ncbi:flagellar biosynthetic protein FlhB [Lachnospiraceae bacterium PF1-21]|uniref:Flagellar biosynthetic protein FlhB n=1 Tax=Ohessyouella blattaphilus TaxID=2949333 RepID=A0ABT1EEM9_9FIRM|nr:flagellar biosynthesis protein FlhB [Ohessyouella blattaphilus]MCP1109135.1 flagellar biosynthesis protein FlhB [Ohessyouella blattaphilus]MCR8562529.1 flagellar biosynthesis protein FlhB [Ohessyouella blattaphilus]MDL2250237.1 flagellar biosynthesis protein FlhB [Lachnospiraceae bacterium OttesenSCG-928-J05]